MQPPHSRSSEVMRVQLAFDGLFKELGNAVRVVSDDPGSKHEFSLDLRKTGPEDVTTMSQWFAD